jgi:hypothetical protein
MDLPLAQDGSLPPLPAFQRWLGAVTAEGVTALRLRSGPPRDDACLPDLLARAGISTVLWPGCPVESCWWEGPAGGRIALLRTAGPSPASIHHGSLNAPWGGGDGDPAAIHALVAMARLEDAAAALTGGGGAAWDAILAGLGLADTPRIPPALIRPRSAGSGAWNPLAFARRAVLAQPVRDDEPAPWAVRDAGGAIEPVQVTEGPLGREWLCSLELGAAAATTLTALDADAPTCHWEVAPGVIDNGRVRAELDDRGRIARLCVDGRFVDLDGPLADPRRDGGSLPGSAAVTVLEEGPVRARVAVALDAADGRLDLVYTLHAHEDCLRIQAAWAGDPERAPVLAHPLRLRGAELVGAGDLARRRFPVAASVRRGPMAPEPGWRWAELDDAGGRGLLLASPAPIVLRAEAGCLEVWLDGTTTWAVTATRAQPGLLAEHLAMGLRPCDLPARAPLLRWGDLGGLVPRWLARRGDEIELLCVDQRGCRGRAVLHPAPGPALPAARISDPAGRTVAPLAPVRERDGWRIDHEPGEVLAIRWAAP